MNFQSYIHFCFRWTLSNLYKMQVTKVEDNIVWSSHDIILHFRHLRSVHSAFFCTKTIAKVNEWLTDCEVSFLVLGQTHNLSIWCSYDTMQLTERWSNAECTTLGVTAGAQNIDFVMNVVFLRLTTFPADNTWGALTSYVAQWLERWSITGEFSLACAMTCSWRVTSG